ncbi:hypothetical protein Tco_0641699 [Tanacetum coccineum]
MILYLTLRLFDGGRFRINYLDVDMIDFEKLEYMNVVYESDFRWNELQHVGDQVDSIRISLTGVSSSKRRISDTDVIVFHHACLFSLPDTSQSRHTPDFHLHCEYLSITRMFWQDLKDNA